jgi:ATP-dependent DNA ligase
MSLAAIEPMAARLVDRLPAPGSIGRRLLYEPKWDGFRAIAHVDEHGSVSLTSRRSKLMRSAFPDIIRAVSERLPPGTTVDGEIVRWSSDGRLDFEALQRRNRAGRGALELARTEPCHYVVFDLLERDGRDLLGAPLSARRAALEELFAGIPGTSPLNIGLQTDDVELAREWFESLAAVGIEGLVIKIAEQPYRPGSRGWWKVKHYATTEAIIGGITGTLDRPQELILGRHSSQTGELDVAGRTTRLDDRAAAEVAAALTVAGGNHPWPDELPPSWTGSMYGRREPAPYLRVVPNIVVEARVDVATQGQRWRHPLRFLRLRPDLEPGDVPSDLQLEA